MDYLKEIENASNIEALENVRVKLLGKEGLITNQIKGLSKLNSEEKKQQGAILNKLKQETKQHIEIKKASLEKKEEEDQNDYTLPYRKEYTKQHPISCAIKKLENIFARIGFENLVGPDVEDTYHNFDALNIKENHPSRESHDTFYMEDEERKDLLLRTHVTAVQIRLLEKIAKEKEFLGEKENKIRAFSIGRVYRNDSHDATHGSMFHQIEGIIIEDGVTMQHLKGCLEFLLKNFFEKEIPIRFRPSYFPFTEPSCEIDIPAKMENGKLEISDFSSGKLVEIGGCGIIHPKILKNFGLENKQAFAFGMGLERWIMLKNGITNFHALYENKVPWLKKYGGI